MKKYLIAVTLGCLAGGTYAAAVPGAGHAAAPAPQTATGLQSAASGSNAGRSAPERLPASPASVNLLRPVYVPYSDAGQRAAWNSPAGDAAVRSWSI